MARAQIGRRPRMCESQRARTSQRRCQRRSSRSRGSPDGQRRCGCQRQSTAWVHGRATTLLSLPNAVTASNHARRWPHHCCADVTCNTQGRTRSAGPCCARRSPAPSCRMGRSRCRRGCCRWACDTTPSSRPVRRRVSGDRGGGEGRSAVIERYHRATTGIQSCLSRPRRCHVPR